MQDLERALSQLQQELIDDARQTFAPAVIDHWLHPRNPGLMDAADGEAWVQGRCGDTLGLFLRVQDGRVADASFVTDGCGSSIASGSVTVSLVRDEPLDRVKALTPQAILEALGGLPADHAHCAELAAETLRAAIDDYEARAGLHARQQGERR